MKREELLALGIEEKNVSEIMAMHGRDIERHKQAVKEKEELAEQLLAQIDKASEQLADYAPNWKEQLQEAQKQAEAQVEDIRIDVAVDKALINAGARDEIAIKAHLNLPKLKQTCEPLLADELARQLDEIKSTHAFLFADAPEFVAFESTPGTQRAAVKNTDDANNAIRAFFSR